MINQTVSTTALPPPHLHRWVMVGVRHEMLPGGEVEVQVRRCPVCGCERCYVMPDRECGRGCERIETKGE